MKYANLKAGSHKTAKRVGRGISAGQGKTAGRGTKGQRSRAGSSVNPGFLGGQNPLMQQLPKLPGFKSHQKPAEIVFTDQLESLNTAVIDSSVLASAGLISNPYVCVKLLNKGEITKKLTVSLPAASAAAISLIQSAGGQFNKVGRLARPVTKTKPTA